MTREQEIQKAIEDIGVAGELIEQARQRCYKASQRLGGVHSPTARKRGIKKLDLKQQAELIGKRAMTLKKQSA